MKFFRNYTACRAGKLAVLGALLEGILEAARQRCVVVSSSTTALDVVGGLCTARRWTTVRIDGATDPARRQEVVDGFNKYNRGQARVFCHFLFVQFTKNEDCKDCKHGQGWAFICVCAYFEYGNVLPIKRNAGGAWHLTCSIRTTETHGL